MKGVGRMLHMMGKDKSSWSSEVIELDLHFSWSQVVTPIPILTADKASAALYPHSVPTM